MKNFLIPIETKVRDYESRLLISLKILSLSNNQNFKIYIGDRRKLLSVFEKRKISQSSTFVYLALGVDQQPIFYKNLYKRNGIFTSLDEESAIFSNNQEKVQKRHVFNKECLKYINKIFTWGNFDSESIRLSNELLNPNVIKLTGNPRFDLSKSDFDFFYSKKYDDRKTNTIFINCAFGVINNYVDQKVDNKLWSLRVKNYPSYETLWKTLEEYESKLFPKFIEGILELVKIFPDEHFIVRPHPVENEAIYEKIFKDCKNVKIDKSASIQSEFLRTKLIIHNGCTTAIEGTFHDINVICFNPYFQADNVQTLTYKVSNLIQDKNSLSKEVSKIIKSNLKPPDNIYEIKDEIIKPLIDNIDYHSFDKIAEELVSIDQEKTLKDFSVSLSNIDMNEKLNIFDTKIRYKLAKYFSKIIINFFHKNYVAQVNLREKKKFSLNLAEIEKDIKILEPFFKLDDQINITSLEENCFELTKFKDKM
tara:strand:- start:841 stop:2274 length:1434 start_codon:yes stop_codon:yes gene_type:complete